MTGFDRIALRLIDQRHAPMPQRLQAFRRMCPQVERQIRRDRSPNGPMAFWGRCRNVDEITGSRIVEPEIQQVLAAAAECPLRPNTPHAGLQHTYAYLFSLLETPFGKKRDRWTNQWLESGFGLNPGSLSPAPRNGTLLANATMLAGSLAFAGHSRKSSVLSRLSGCTDQTVAHWAGQRHPGLQLIETARATSGSGCGFTLQLRTTLLRMPLADSCRLDAPWLLVYSVADSRRRNPQLITLFTITDQSCDEITARARRRLRNDIRPRYNTHVPGFTRSDLKGRCELRRYDPDEP